MKRMIFTALIFAAFLTGTCLAAPDIQAAQSDALAFDALERAAEGYGPATGGDLDAGLGGLLEAGLKEAAPVIKKALASGVTLLVVVLLCSLVGGMEGAAEGRTPSALPMAAALAIAAVAVTDVTALIGLGRRAIETMGSFSKVLLPTMAAAAAASGSPAGATARQLATLLFSDVLMTVISGVLVPLTYAYIAACTAFAAVGNEGLRRVAATIKWATAGILTVILVVFTGYLTITGAIAGTADAVTIKAAKVTMSGMVPVVGGILSDAAETVLAGAGVLRNAVGVFGMLAVLGMCVVPFLQLGFHYLVYKLSAALSATVADSRAAALIDQIGGAFGLVLGMTASCALLLLVSMVSAISVVTP